MIREGLFWRRVGAVLCILIVLSAIANSFRNGTVPGPITLLLFGGLAALCVGVTIANPGSSTAHLGAREERRFRRGQYAVGFAFSAVLGLTLAVKAVRDSALVWLFLPIMILPVILIVRERIERG